MGGLIILNSSLVSVVLWGRFSLTHPYLIIAIFITLWMGVIGLLDDALKLQQKRRGEKNRGLVERYKLIGQVTAGLALGVYLWQHPLAPNLPGASTTLPFFKYYVITPLAGFAWLYVLFTTFILTGTSNAVNITDGLDGLAAGLSAVAFGTFAIFAYIIGRIDYSRFLYVQYLQDSGELTVFCLAMVGALIGFLWFNAHPAQVFMGDTGALALGGALGSVAILLKSEFVLAFVGAVFVAEMLSVIFQRYVFKYRKSRYGLEYAQAHRVFLRAPLHHHFEEKGWKETQVVVRFWIIGILCAFFALSTLKLR
jgi:phospho-N-acetylmuramoyl-pentapeptide-transferase